MSVNPSRLAVPVGERDHFQGPADAMATLVEYGDYECPYTRRAHPIVKEVQRVLGDQLRFVFRNFPLTEIHPHAEQAAEAAEAAGAQGKFWEMHDLLFDHQRDLDTSHLLDYAGQIKLDVERVGRELTDRTYLPLIVEEMDGGIRSEVQGTPTFFINGQQYHGRIDRESLILAMRTATP